MPDEDSPDNPSRISLFVRYIKLISSGFYVQHVKHGPGHLILHPPTLPSETGAFTPARITFTTIRRVPASANVALESESQPSKGDLTISANDIVSLKKTGMGLAGRTLTSWALDAAGAGGTVLEIRITRRDINTDSGSIHEKEHSGPIHGQEMDNEEDVMVGGKQQTIKLRGIVRRNELFQRLSSIGEQRWEML